MKNLHLTLEQREQIQIGFEFGISKKEIAQSKEIKNKRKLKPRNTFNHK